MTVDQIISEAEQLPPDQVSELVDRLTLSLHRVINSTVEDDWRQEARKRLAETESGCVQVIFVEEVSDRIRHIVGR